jgi:transposase
MKILGIDLGKYKSAACLFDSDTHETLHFTFPSFANEFKSLLANTHPE